MPASVFHRIRATEALGVSFAYWLWGEQFPQPAFRSAPEVVEAPRPRLLRLDPIVIGMIPTAPNRGLWVRLGVWFH